MTIRERLQALDRVQKTRSFKIGASALVALLAITVLAVFFIQRTSPGGAADAPETPEQVQVDGDTSGDAQAAPTIDPRLEQQQREAQLLYSTLVGDGGATGVVTGVLGAAGTALVIIWLGAGLTYLALGVVGGAVVVPLYLFEPTANIGRLLAGVLVLTLAFTALLQGLRLVFSLPGTPMAIASNVLAEAVRLKISIVFIVLLVFGLAALPLLLDPETPLRYRVQAFLQYATDISFWTIALLVVFFSVATVAFEQRDKVIWQTMTKPVAAWQYLLGKWMGVAGLAAVLLFVSASGIFLFTEFLRAQPTQQERAAGELQPGQVMFTEDRLVLETEVLSARERVIPLTVLEMFDINLDAQVDARVEAEKRQDVNFRPTVGDMARFRLETLERLSLEYQSIDPVNEQFEEFIFVGLGPAREVGLPITLRYKPEAEGNRPDTFYELSFRFTDGTVINRTTGLGFSHTIALSSSLIDESGLLAVQIYNGRLQSAGASMVFIPNAQPVTFTGDGLEVAYAASTYHMNFLRIAGVLWIKLAFLAAIGVWAATFLKFEIASLVSIAMFLIAESARFVHGAVDQFGTTNIEGEERAWRHVVTWIADAVSSGMLFYADLNPTERLSFGLLMSWRDVATGALIILILVGALYASGVVIFRRRELATYSGQ